MGMSRSATIVIMYLMRGEKMTLKEAWEFAKERRYLIKPNPKFVIELWNYERKLYGNNSINPEGINALCK